MPPLVSQVEPYDGTPTTLTVFIELFQSLDEVSPTFETIATEKGKNAKTKTMAKALN